MSFPNKFIPTVSDNIIWGSAFKFLSNPIKFLQKSVKDYGPIVKFRIGFDYAYIVCEPDVAIEILRKKHLNFKKTPRAMSVFRKYLGDASITLEGEEFRQRIRLMRSGFTPANINSFGSSMVEKTKSMAASLKNGDEIMMMPQMENLALSIMLSSLFSDAGENYSDSFKMVSETIQNIIAFLILRPIYVPEWIPTKLNRALKKAKELTDASIRNILSERRESNIEHKDLLSSLILARDEENYLNEEQLLAEVKSIYVGGHETTSRAMVWMFYLLSKHTEIEKKLYEEVDALGHDPTSNDVDKLIISTQIVKETLRMYPPVWLITRNPEDDVVVEGYKFNKGKMVIIPQCILHYDERFYDEPDKFKPERWTQDLIDNLPKGSYLPFSSGSHACPGAQFAIRELILVLATMSRYVSFRLVDENEQIDVSPKLTLMPEKPMRMRIIRRK